jgi:DNA gyrase subunit B
MQTELLDRGLDGTGIIILPLPDSKAERVTLGGERFAHLLKLTSRMEDALKTLEKRGLGLRALIERVNKDGILPYCRVLLSGREYWFFSPDEVDAFRKQEQEKAGKEFVAGNEDQQPIPVHDPEGVDNAAAPAVPPEDVFYAQELHEIRDINKTIEELKVFGLLPTDLIPPVRIAGREPVPRLVLTNGDTSKNLEHLRGLVVEVRRIGEKGMTITRFKGLGEMDPEELWDTTLDPHQRTLMQIKLDDAFKADEMFRTLMGDKVEPRRDFIHKYALQVTEIDYHGA